MKIKQQKQVKSYLIEEFGPNKGNEIFDKQEKEVFKLFTKFKYFSRYLIKVITNVLRTPIPYKMRVFR